MTVSAIRAINNNPRISFGKNESDKEGHAVIGSVLGAAAGLGAAKLMPALDLKTINNDTFSKAYDQLAKSAVEDDKPGVEAVKKLFIDDKTRVSVLFDSLKISKDASEISLVDLINSNTTPESRWGNLAHDYATNDWKKMSKEAQDADPNFINRQAGKLEALYKSEQKVIPPEHYNPEWLKNDAEFFAKNKELGKSTHSRFVFSIAEKIENGKISMESLMDMLKTKAATELEEGIASNRDTLLKIVDKINASKLYILGAVGLVAGGVIGHLVKTKVAEDGES